MEKDYGLNFSGTFIMRGGDDSCECGIKISDNDGFEYSNDFSGDIDEMADFFYKDMVNAIVTHYYEKKKEEKEEAKKTVEISTPVDKQDDYVARLRALEQRNRDLEKQLAAFKKENKKDDGSKKKAKRVAPNHTSRRIRSDIFDDIFRDSFFTSLFDM